jgi:hypothetical protein
MIVGRLEANFYERNTFRKRGLPTWELHLDEITGEYLELPQGTRVQVEVVPGKWMELALDSKASTIINGMWVKLV